MYNVITNNIWLFKPVICTRFIPMQENKFKGQRNKNASKKTVKQDYLKMKFAMVEFGFNSLYFHMAYMQIFFFNWT